VNINLHIERLVIDGIDFDSTCTEQLKFTAESTLRHYLQTQGLGSEIQSLHQHRPVDGGAIPISNPPRPDRLGKQIGNAVFRSIKK